ncbi:DUF397 domain-containing protein [Streptomyces sp. SM12]|nr:DUF397 domain-containing protein [Streptomyces sp. SM12]
MGGNECVALASACTEGGGWVAVRDSKHGRGGPALVVPGGAAVAFLGWVC